MVAFCSIHLRALIIIRNVDLDVTKEKYNFHFSV